MPRPTTSLDGLDVFGNSRTHRYHHRSRLTRNCQVDAIIRAHHLVAFWPDSVAQAELEGFGPCQDCAR
jgi:hypothetical protein